MVPGNIITLHLFTLTLFHVAASTLINFVPRSISITPNTSSICYARHSLPVCTTQSRFVHSPAGDDAELSISQARREHRGGTFPQRGTAQIPARQAESQKTAVPSQTNRMVADRLRETPTSLSKDWCCTLESDLRATKWW